MKDFRKVLSVLFLLAVLSVLFMGADRSGGLCDVRLVWPCFMASRSGQYGGL